MSGIGSSLLGVQLFAANPRSWRLFRRRAMLAPEAAMARDAGLEELIRNELPPGLRVTEKPMFGGLAWLLDGNLLVGARNDGMLARLGKGADDWALALPDVEPMISAGRTMSGWVRAGPEAWGDDALRARLIAAALTFVKDLPPKA